MPLSDAVLPFEVKPLGVRGRVVRLDQGNDTVSEGQAYGMLIAVAVDDERDALRRALLARDVEEPGHGAVGVGQQRVVEPVLVGELTGARLLLSGTVLQADKLALRVERSQLVEHELDIRKERP